MQLKFDCSSWGANACATTATTFARAEFSHSVSAHVHHRPFTSCSSLKAHLRAPTKYLTWCQLRGGSGMETAFNWAKFVFLCFSRDVLWWCRMPNFKVELRQNNNQIVPLMIRQMFMLIRLSKYLGHSVVLHAISGGSIKIWQIMFECVAERFPSDYVFVIKSKISRQWKAEIKKKSATETIARDIKKLIVLSATHDCSVCVCIPYCLGEPSINVNWRKALRSNRH